MSFLCYRIIREPVERYRACKLSTANKGIHFKAPLDFNEKRRGFSHAFVIWINDVISVWWNQLQRAFSYLIYHTIILVFFDFFINNIMGLALRIYSLLVRCITRHVHTQEVQYSKYNLSRTPNLWISYMSKSWEPHTFTIKDSSGFIL